MTFIENNPVRSALRGAEFLYPRKERFKKSRPFAQGDAGQVDRRIL
jgi:hypothetical protein